METIQKVSSLSWIEVQFLSKAVETLGKCRTFLKWTYAMAFYLQKNNETQMFEDNQKWVFLILVLVRILFVRLTLIVFPFFEIPISTAISNKPSNLWQNWWKRPLTKTRFQNDDNWRRTRLCMSRDDVRSCWKILWEGMMRYVLACAWLNLKRLGKKEEEQETDAYCNLIKQGRWIWQEPIRL